MFKIIWNEFFWSLGKFSENFTSSRIFLNTRLFYAFLDFYYIFHDSIVHFLFLVDLSFSLQSLLLPAIIRYCIILYKVEGEFFVFQFDTHFFWYIYMNICIYNRYEMKHLFEIFVLWIVRILLLALALHPRIFVY